MTLRLRLVLALVGVVLTGLVLFGFATYSFYARSQYDRRGDQLRSSPPSVTRQLADKAADITPPELDEQRGGDLRGGRFGNGGNGPPAGLPLVTYSELRNDAGAVVTQVQ